MRLFWKRLLACIALMLLVAMFGAYTLVRSGWFRERVRTWILTSIHQATGAQAELGSFSFDPNSLTVKTSGLVLHGNEAKEEPPLLSVESATLGLRVLSVLKREFDLDSLHVLRPSVNVILRADGTTNLPKLSERPFTEDLMKLRIGRYDIDDGVFDYAGRSVPFQAHGEGLAVRMALDPRTGFYRGNITATSLRLAQANWMEAISARAAFTLTANRLEIDSGEVGSGAAQVTLQGSIEDMREPLAKLAIRATLPRGEASRILRTQLCTQAAANFEGTLAVPLLALSQFKLDGKAVLSGLDWEQGRIHIRNGSVDSNLAIDIDGIQATSIVARALDATFRGRASIKSYSALHAEGNLSNLDVHSAGAMFSDRQFPWSGTLAGPVTIDAQKDVEGASVRADLTVTPGASNPIDGHIALSYDPGAGTFDLGSSYLATAASRIDVSGLLGTNMRVALRSTSMEDLQTALDAAGWHETIPLKLRKGAVTANGSILGSLDAPRFRGNISATSATLQNHDFDRFAAEVEASGASVALQRIDAAVGEARASGNLTLNAPFENPGIAGDIVLRSTPAALLAQAAGWSEPISGVVGATLHLEGTLQHPQASGSVDVSSPTFLGEKLDRIRATIRASENLYEASNGEASDGPARALFSGSYAPAASELRFDTTISGLTLNRIEGLPKLDPQPEAQLSSTLRGSARVINRRLEFTELNGTASARSIRLAGTPLGELNATFRSQATDLLVNLAGSVKESTISGQGQWKLSGNETGSLSARISRMSTKSIRDLGELLGLAPVLAQGTELPFEGFLETHVDVRASLTKLEDASADLIVDALRLTPKRTASPSTGTAVQDVTLENSEPIAIALNVREAAIRTARLRARNTSLEVSGLVPFEPGKSADLRFNGAMDLAILQLLNADLAAKGSANVSATMTGSMKDPKLNGRLELRGASLYLGDLANGIDNANGVVNFDNRRATISRLSAETGGGTVQLGGYLEFLPELTYRVTADAKQVRVRWPETLSTTASAHFALNGTPSSSTLSGELLLERAGFAANTDFGALLAEASQPIPAASPNDYLRGVQFDVRVRNAPTFEVQTSLTRQLAPAVDLRLRGSPQRPVLLGNVSVDRGELQLFGNRYNIARCDIRFANAVRIEPAFDMNLETVARGVAVNVSFAGTMQKFRINYSSDPPLEPQEIVALLAVGRDPNQQGILTSQPNATSAIETGGSLLSDAVTAQLSSRLQRFFGASRVKIDPKITGVENLPLARLTLEQQLSKDVTLTYITNLNRTQEQIVRIQWDMNRNWSAVAVRDSNGLFGIDFQYRKRFR